MLKTINKATCYLFILFFGVLTAKADILGAGQTTFQNPDFSIHFPASINYIQKREYIPTGGNKPANAYLYVNSKYPNLYVNSQDANITNLTPRANQVPGDSYFYVLVAPMIKTFNTSAEMIKAQRAFIALIVGSNQFESGFTSDKSYYSKLTQQMSSLQLNGRTYQTYTLKLPKLTIEYFTFIQNQHMYFFQAFLVNSTSSSLTDEIVKQILQSVRINKQ